MLGRLLVYLSGIVVSGLVDLVAKGVLGGREAGADVDIVVLGHLLVGLLGARRHGSLDRLGDVVGGVAELVHCGGRWGLFEYVCGSEAGWAGWIAGG